MSAIPTLTRLSKEEVREADQRPLDLKLIRRLLEQTRPYGWLRNWLVVLVLIRSLQLPGLTWIVIAVITGPVARGDTTGVVWGAFAFFLLALSTQFVMHFRQRFALELGEAVVRDLRNAIFAHLQSLPLGYFHRTKVGRIISRMISDVEDVRAGVQEVFFVSLVQVGQMLVAAACMLWADPFLFLIVLALAPILWSLNRYFRKALSDSLRLMRESFSRVTATLAESVIGIRVTQGYVRQDENARLFAALVADHSQYNTRVLRLHGLFIPLLEWNSQLFVALLLLAGSAQALSTNSPEAVGALVSFLFMANLFFAPISVLGNQYNQALTAMAGAERIFALLDTPPDWTDAPTARALPSLRGDVEFDHVTFGYDPARPVVREISFLAKAGEMIALVGPTGSGKTTLVNLLAKYYLPQSGTIRLDGTPLNDWTTHSVRRRMGIVLQQNFLFQGTVAENIRFGKPDATDEEVRAVCRSLQCLDLLEALPEGLQTEVGERGTRLSLGQRQLVCFARSLLIDPRILILDEATSSIDVQTEQRLQQALQVLIAGRTSFVVAHRLSTIRKADRILMLEAGAIVEQGTHPELVARQGAYAKLYHRFAAAGWQDAE